MITFTIITCTFNAQSVAKRTFRSVLRQTYRGVEHLIIDGASTDDTLAMVRNYQYANDKERTGHIIKVTSEKDQGLYFAMNKGLKQAQNDYIVFLNAGDTFPSGDTLDRISLSVGEREDLPGVLYGDTDIVDNDGNFLRHRRLCPPEHLSWRSFKWGMLVCHQSFYALTKIARDIPYNTNYHYSADVDWCIRIMQECEKEGLKLRNVHGVVTHYLAEGLTTKNHKASLKERFRVMKKHYGLLITLWVHLCFAFRAFYKH